MEIRTGCGGNGHTDHCITSIAQTVSVYSKLSPIIGNTDFLVHMVRLKCILFMFYRIY